MIEDVKKRYAKEREEIFRHLEEFVSQPNLSKEDYARYRYEWKINNDYFNCLDYAIEQGLEQGIEQGIKQGIERGREKNKLENAKRMKDKGYPLEEIADITGLSIEEIEKL